MQLIVEKKVIWLKKQLNKTLYKLLTIINTFKWIFNKMIDILHITDFVKKAQSELI